MTESTESKRALVIGAHPDDNEFGADGSHHNAAYQQRHRNFGDYEASSLCYARSSLELLQKDYVQLLLVLGRLSIPRVGEQQCGILSCRIHPSPVSVSFC
jgi:hypothetical protein